MNLNSLFNKQQKLDEYIIKEKGLEDVDLLPRKTVALICELYECVNEARFFKYWSEDTKPKGKMLTCQNCRIRVSDTGRYREGDGHCNEIGDLYYHNPLLEEYVDTIHFTLSIANDLGYTSHEYTELQPMDLNELTLGITNIASTLHKFRTKKHIETLFNYVILLGYQLGFDEKMVIEAYHEKNKENYKRQKAGY